MTRHQIWQRYKEYGYEGVNTIQTNEAMDTFYLAILAFGEQEIEQAVRYAQAAAKQAPDKLVFTEAVIYLHRVLEAGKQGVYVTGEAFSKFIRGGGNVPLYENLSSTLCKVYQEYDALHLLDVGVGDGMALLPALTDNIKQLDILEPSEIMFKTVCTHLQERGIMYRAANSTLQEFIATRTETWDVIESTFCLHTLPPEERPEMFSWFHAHGRRVLIAEFDCPEPTEMYAPDLVDYILEHYEVGLAEYIEDRELVSQGFLMPVMFGNFDQTEERSTYEQPIRKWTNELKTAGFDTIRAMPLYSYWWAPAYLLDAH